MSKVDKFEQAAAARSRAHVVDPTPVPTGTQKNTTTTTVTLSRHTRAALTRAFAELTLQHHVQVPIGPVGAALYDLFLENPTITLADGTPVDLQKEVVRRLT